MKLRSKLFLSHVLVTLTSVILMGLIAFAFSDYFLITEEIDTQTQLSDTPPPSSEQKTSETSQSLGISEIFLTGLVLAGITATLIAAGVSWWMSQRITRPLKQLAAASQIIREGHYEQRLDILSSDEIGELAQQFNLMAEALNNIEQTRRRLLADVSHEFKTPLTTIKGYIEGLQDGVIVDTEATYNLIYVEASRLQRLVHDLQLLAQAESGTPTHEHYPCDIIQVLQTSITRLQSQFDSKSIVIQSDFPPTIPQIQVDSQRLEQVFINLLGNTLQYTPQNGEVQIKLIQVEGVLRITIQDTGIGIPPENLQLIFQRFYRVDESRARVSGGSGIGLTIAQHIVEAHGGRIWAESDGLGLGSIFTVELPLASTS